MKKICVIGNFSGRNAGDAALLEGLLTDVFSINQDLEFLIPTINKKFVEKTYKQFPIKAVPMMPWNLSLKIFGVPIVRAILNSDVIMLADAILFDRRFWNPTYNYLSTLSMVLPMAKKKGIPTILYNMSLGPVSSRLGKLCMRRVLDCSDLVIVRDMESIEMLNSLNLQHNDVKIGADCALNISLPPVERIEQIKKNESIFEEKGRYLSFNISSYVGGVFVKGTKKGIDINRFIQIIAETIDRIIEEMNKKIIIIITQLMDLSIARKILKKVYNRQSTTLISNKTYNHNEIAGILSKVEINVGMRTHSLILATSFCTPTICIIAYPKNRGYMKTIEQEERMIEFGDSFTTENLFTLIKDTWKNRGRIKRELEPVIAREKAKAKQSAGYLKKYLA